MKFTIQKEIFDKFPGLTVGLLTAKGINNAGEQTEVLDLLKKQSEIVREENELVTLGENPKIAAWREAYKSFGAKPKKHLCSVESLYDLVLDGVDLRHINTIVDIYNYISLKYMMPVGGDDIDKVDGNITLRLATGDENFTLLNTDEVSHPKPGEVIYADDKEVLCRRWNWRECDKSKMTEETKNVEIVVEALPPATKEEVEKATQELGELIKKYTSGEIKTRLLSREDSEIEIEI